MSLLKESQPEVLDAAQARPAGRRYWRSLDELERTPQFQEFLHREFPEGASELLSPVSRRAFLNLMGASVALAGGLTACRKPKNLILPFTHRPEDYTPGIAQHYATTFERGGDVLGLIVESHEGRPTKIEGHPDHPANRGAVDTQGQAAILELYDPDRSSGPLNAGQKAAAAQFDKEFEALAVRMRAAQGAGLAILTEKTTSPSLLAQRATLRQALPRATWHVWEPVGDDSRLEGARLAFGRAVEALYDFEKADTIVALGSDFIASGPNHVYHAQSFARRRRREGGQAALNRLYSVESAFSLTGAMADHRLRLAPSQVAAYALALCAELVHGQGLAVPGELGEALRPSLKHNFNAKWVTAVAGDLRKSAGRSLIVAGPGLPAPVQAAVHQVNSLLGADCVSYRDPAGEVAPGPIQAAASLADLVQKLNAGQVEALVILGGNPVWDAPADLAFADALKKAKNSIHLSLYANETSLVSAWHSPRAHFLESWGDARWANGTVSMVQPLIAPLFDGRTDSELLAWLGDLPQKRAYDIVREFHRAGRSEAEFETVWRTMLHDGVLAGEAQATAPAAVAPVPGVAAALSAWQPAPVPTAQSLEVVFQADSKLHDGRYSNNGWLQETPDSTTKLTWCNAALMGLETAKALGLGNAQGYGRQTQDIVKLEVGGKSVELPIWIVPGMADFTVVVNLGYGRERGGRIAEGIGTNVYPIRTSLNLYSAAGAKIAKTGRRVKMPSTQDHWAMEGRDLVREANPAEPNVAPHPAGVAAEAHGEAHAEEHEKAPQLWEPKYKYNEQPQWGMVIDLNSCIGCNACTVACQAENNIPIVGPEQVLNGREMHWIRVDRYFAVEGAPVADVDKGALTDPGYSADTAQMVFQPMPCQHCENAPCEQVCPVGATVHSPDGINEMIYNRCIGTRYCNNNCPFKVRRFNYFNFHEPNDLPMRLTGQDTHNPLYKGTGGKSGLDKKEQSLLHMAANPYVTVRSRGVMEKCTFCTQRVNRARHAAKKEDRPIRDGEVVSACAQTCPTGAITFGDILDPASKVSQKKKDPTNYTLLDDLNVKPRVSYLAKLRNPNPEMVA